jgi:protein SCO1
MFSRRELLTNRLGIVTGAPAVLAMFGSKNAAQRGPRADYFPNSVIQTHEGRSVRFYDDLIHGKIVAINMMYADCSGICPAMTANLVKVQKRLGDRVGRDIFMYSITLTPEVDTPEKLKAYAEHNGVGPGWQFLTGRKADIELIRRKLGFVDPDPVLDRDKSTHTGMVRVGNEKYDQWAGCAALGPVDQIVESILWMDIRPPQASGQGSPARVRPAASQVRS